MDMNKKRLGLLWSLASIFGIAAYTILGKLAYAHGVGDAVNFALQTALVAAIILFLTVIWAERGRLPRIDAKSWKYVLWAGFFGGALNYGFSFFGLQHTTVINDVFITESSVFFTVVLASIFLGERLTLKKTLLVVFLMSGVYLISTGGKNIIINRGDIFVLLASFFVSVGYIFAKRGLGAVPAIIFSAYRTALAAIMLFGYLLVSGTLSFPVYYFWSLVNGVVQAAAIFTVYKAFEYATASYASLMMVAATVVTAVGAWLILGESMTAVQMLGGAIILVSAGLTNKMDA